MKRLMIHLALILGGLSLTLTLAGCGTLYVSGRVVTTPTLAQNNVPGYTFADCIVLESYSLPDLQIPAGTLLPLHLSWQVTATPTHPYALGIGLRGTNGLLAWNTSTQSISWTSGQLTTEHDLQFPPEMDEGDYGLEVWLYDPDSGARASVNGQETDVVRVAVIHLIPGETPSTPSPPPTSALSQLVIEGTVQSVALSARVIWLSEDVQGVETIALTDGAQIADRQGRLLSLDQIQPGQHVQATGEKLETSLRATQIIVDHDDTPKEATVTPMVTPTIEWQEYSADELQVGFRYPPDWQVSEENKIVYVYSDKTTDNGARYYIYLEEYPAPQMQSVEQVIEDRWGSEIAQNAQIVEVAVGDKTVYETVDIPSAEGALTIFVRGEKRYIAVSLTPYEEQAPNPGQQECERVLLDMAGSIVFER